MTATAPCPVCTHAATAGAVTVPVDIHGHTVILAMERCECTSCGWLWATAPQRQHNDQVFNRGYTRVTSRGLW